MSTELQCIIYAHSDKLSYSNKKTNVFVGGFSVLFSNH